MKILILTTYSTVITDQDQEYKKESTWRLFTHLNKKHDATIARYNDLHIKIADTGTEISYQETPLNKYDFIIFRATTCEGVDLEWIAQIVADYTFKHDINSLNASHFVFFGGNWNKLRQSSIFANAGIPIPKTIFTSQNNISYPIVAKPRFGSHGKGVYLVNSAAEFPAEPEEYLFQELLPNNVDYRVIVLNDKVVGVISRKAADGNFVSNVSAGGVASKVEVSSEMEDISLKLAKLCKLDFCGIDLMKDGSGELKVLEVNRHPEFNGFEQATGILVPPLIEEFIQSL